MEDAAHPQVSYHTSTEMITVMQADGAALLVMYHTTMTTIMQVEAMPTTMGWLAANERTGAMMVLLIMGLVVVSLLVTNEHTGKTMVLLITGVVARGAYNNGSDRD